MLTFEIFKNRGLVSLSHSNSEHLLDLLEDAQATLALMLTSRHIGPLRDEAAAWAIKLKEISEVLEQVSALIMVQLPWAPPHLLLLLLFLFLSVRIWPFSHFMEFQFSS